jgi:hypothetical protein
MMNEKIQQIVKAIKQPDGTLQYHVSGVETWEESESLVQFIIREFDAEIIDSLDGICSRTWTLVIGTITFTLKHHDDIGNYFYCSSGTSGGEALMQRIVNALNARLADRQPEEG